MFLKKCSLSKKAPETPHISTRKIIFDLYKFLQNKSSTKLLIRVCFAKNTKKKKNSKVSHQGRK